MCVRLSHLSRMRHPLCAPERETTWHRRIRTNTNITALCAVQSVLPGVMQCSLVLRRSASVMCQRRERRGVMRSTHESGEACDPTRKLGTFHVLHGGIRMGGGSGHTAASCPTVMGHSGLHSAALLPELLCVHVFPPLAAGWWNCAFSCWSTTCFCPLLRPQPWPQTNFTGIGAA